MSELITDNALVMQFGTSRFLQAHVDYFISQSNDARLSNTSIVVVQSSKSPAGLARVSAMNTSADYPLKIQGIKDGKVVDTQEQVAAITQAYQATKDWSQVLECFCQRVTHVVSNTADQGYLLSDKDSAASVVPESFPAKLLVLLKARYDRQQAPVTIMPCELVANNGDVLKEILFALANDWRLEKAFIKWLVSECLWVNSLVDRIVSESIEPLGAVTEPYALWAIEQQAGLALPCQHPDIRIVDTLLPLETLKLCVLNLSHSFVVDLWMQAERSTVQTVLEAMQDSYLRTALDKVLQQEVLPVLLKMQLAEDCAAYIDSVIERFSNPFLAHKLADIAQNHQSKVQRRILPLVKEGERLLPELKMLQLRQCLLRNELGACLA